MNFFEMMKNIKTKLESKRNHSASKSKNVGNGGLNINARGRACRFLRFARPAAPFVKHKSIVLFALPIGEKKVPHLPSKLSSLDKWFLHVLNQFSICGTFSLKVK